MEDWNVVVTVREHGFVQACEFLQMFGTVARSDYFNVLTLAADDPTAFPEALHRELERQPELLKALARVVPVVHTFRFQDPYEFEERVCQLALAWVKQLAGHSFHVRMHRRGFKHRIESQHEELFLDHWLIEQLQAEGENARVTFDDPDYILAVETVGQRAGLSFWSRDQRERYAFLGLD